MSPLFENAVIISIVIAILFFGYHVAMFLIHKEAKTIATKMQVKPVVSSQLVDKIPSNSDGGGGENSHSTTPVPSDPQHKSESSATFTTELRNPENSFSKHEVVPGGDSGPTIDAQNEGAVMNGVSAWNGDSAQPFSSVDEI